MNPILKKICTICKEEKTHDFFGKNKREKDGRHYYCTDCVRNMNDSNKEENREYFKEYRKNNKEELRDYQKEYRTRIARSNDDSDVDNEDPIDNRQKKRDQEKERRKNEEFKSNRRDYFRHKYMTDIQWNFKKKFESKLNRLFKNNDDTEKTKELIGCTMTEFKAYLEPKFLPGMSWTNYGTEWNFDRIIPFCDFDLSDPEEAKKCFHYTNVEPMFVQTKIIDGKEFLGNSNKNRF